MKGDKGLECGFEGCGKKFALPQSALNHFKTFHKSEYEKSIINCNSCPYVCDSTKSLDEHMVHEHKIGDNCKKIIY